MYHLSFICKVLSYCHLNSKRSRHYINCSHYSSLCSTGCVRNTWWFLKFENLGAHYAPLACWPSSFTVMFGALLRGSTGQCNAALQELKRFCKQSPLELYSVVSVSSFKFVMRLAALLCYCGYWSGVKKDQRRTVNHKNIHSRLVHLTTWSG